MLTHNFMSIAAKMSDLVDETSGANLQMEGHADMPPQSAKDLQELEASGSSPSHLTSWSPARRPPSSHPRDMCDIDRRTRGSASTFSFLDSTLVEDMLCDARTRLTKAVVIGPGKVVLFYGRHSMGEGLTVDESRDATFLLTGAGTWVGNLAYLTAYPMTIQEGR